MGMARYFVFPRGKTWLVTLDGVTMGSHGSKPDALKSAIVMSDLMGSMQHDSDVVLEDAGKLEIAWTFGTDPLPDAIGARQ